MAPASSLSRQVIRDRLYTPGELLRMEQLQPDMEAVELQTKQLHLFGSPEKVVAR